MFLFLKKECIAAKPVGQDKECGAEAAEVNKKRKNKEQNGTRPQQRREA
jgi:hypothetical protein